MSDKKFSKDYIDKAATQQREFLKKYPKCDGRGLLIAILDTGVDLSFPGMQKTSTGFPKVDDSFDFTGAGNVDTSIVKEVDNNNIIVGLTGRLLKIPTNWINPSGKWHLGMKSIYEMCSGVELESIIKKRNESILQQNKVLEQSINKNNKDDFNAAIKYLKMTEDLSKDSLVADCIVWFNGENWQACIDTFVHSFVGDLENVKVLTNYNVDHEYDTVMDILSYCIKIHNNGNLLEIISAFHDHGSCVAQVAAACFPGEPERNGLAPGAQVISMTVMDSRDGNYLNDNALKKAFVKCIELKVDIVNCSFRCSTKDFEKEITEMIEKHGIMIIFGAGNSGPVHSSLDRDISLNPHIYMIGSVGKRKMKQHKISYEVCEYSSRGPNIYGDRGVCFVAPGHATITYPHYYQSKTSLQNGTSLAAPNVAGSIACLLTALKNMSLKYSPTTVKFALSQTSRQPENGNELSYGHGIIQILAAFDFYKRFQFSKLCENCNHRVKLSNENKSGIVLKVDGKDGEINKTYTVEILNKPDAENVKLKLTKRARKFIHCSEVENNSFKAELQTKSFKPGTINYAQICGIDSTNLTTFYLSITVINPEMVTKEENYRIQKDVTLTVEDPFRLFLLAPEKSRQCLVKITALENTSTHIHIHHAVEDAYVDDKKAKWLVFDTSNKIQTHYIEVFGNKIHEISLNLSSSTSTSGKFKIEIDFFGIHEIVSKPEENKNNVLTILNLLEPLTATLSLEFNKVSYNLAPENVCNESIKYVYDADSAEYLKLTYFFTITHETKCSFKLNHKKEFPVLRAQIFTETKKFVHGFYYNYKKFVTLLPGKYSIIVYVSYSSSSDINNNSIPPSEELPTITLTMELQQPHISEVYSNPSKNKESTYTKEKLINNGSHQIYFQPISSKRLRNPMPSTITLQGILKVKNSNFKMGIPIKHEYFLKNEKQQKTSNPETLSLLTESFKDVSINHENPKSNSFNNNFIPAKPLPKNLNKFQKEVILACRNFLLKPESDFYRKDYDPIEEAIASGHFGKALLLMNKFSTKTQTNPNFKVIDLAIITLLKHLKWNHLVEAHQNALLDRYRDHYRLL